MLKLLSVVAITAAILGLGACAHHEDEHHGSMGMSHTSSSHYSK